MIDPRALFTQIALTFGGVLTLLGLVFGGIGLARRAMSRTWVRTAGMIVTRHGHTSGMRERHPTFQWIDETGQRHQHTSSVYSSFGPRPGQQITVLYDPNNPDRGMLDTGIQRGVFVTVLGGVFLFLGIAILIGLLVVRFAG